MTAKIIQFPLRLVRRPNPIRELATRVAEAERSGDFETALDLAREVEALVRERLSKRGRTA
jgi:hypothetical protein